MKKLIYAINLSVDGCCDHTKMVPNEELFDYYIALLSGADTFLYGRKTYQLMVPYWPDIAKNPTGDALDHEYALAFEAVDNMVVLSRSLDAIDGKNTSIISRNLEEEIRKLKQQSGKNILTGGVDIPSQLLKLGLIDEFHVVILPVVVGEGRRLFDSVNLPENLKLELVESKVFKSGCVALRYAKR